MRQAGSLNHSRWECKYHVIFIPKYRKKAIFGQKCSELGDVLRRLAGGGYLLNSYWSEGLWGARPLISNTPE